MKRLFDILCSLILILLSSPLLLIMSILVGADSRGGVFYGQTRVGLNGILFKMWKFRTMHPNAETKGQLTVGARDPRITRVGYYLRKFKVDELPQLWNVFIGDMSLVGPRPEVPKYVEYYTAEQRQVLSIRPGITDEASLKYFEENKLLAESSHPEQTYIEEIMPAKLRLNLEYARRSSLSVDLVILFKTVVRMIRG